MRVQLLNECSVVQNITSLRVQEPVCSIRRFEGTPHTDCLFPVAGSAPVSNKITLTFYMRTYKSNFCGRLQRKHLFGILEQYDTLDSCLFTQRHLICAHN